MSEISKNSGNSNRNRPNFIIFCSNLKNEESNINVTSDSHDFLKEEENNIDIFNTNINDIFTNNFQKEFDIIVSEMTKHRENMKSIHHITKI